MGDANKDQWSGRRAVNAVPLGKVFDSARLPPTYAAMM